MSASQIVGNFLLLNLQQARINKKKSLCTLVFKTAEDANKYFGQLSAQRDLTVVLEEQVNLAVSAHDPEEGTTGLDIATRITDVLQKNMQNPMPKDLSERLKFLALGLKS